MHKKNPRPRPGAIGCCRAEYVTLLLTLLATLAALALSALTTLLAALSRLLLLLTRLLLAAALLAALATLTALPAALVLLSTLLATLILLARLLFIRVHVCFSNSLPVVTTSALKRSSFRRPIVQACVEPNACDGGEPGHACGKDQVRGELATNKMHQRKQLHRRPCSLIR
jgi:hypothetical protein